MDVNEAEVKCPYCEYEATLRDFADYDDIPEMDDVLFSSFGIDIDTVTCPSCEKEFTVNVSGSILVNCLEYTKEELENSNESNL